ncbi:MAG: hypothetical protein ACM3U2_04810 [Deltaproteobacteria bacterium]
MTDRNKSELLASRPDEFGVTRMKSLADKQRLHISDVLRRLREHFAEWPCPAGFEHELMRFAYYEGCGYRWECCREILDEAAPFAVGQELVANHGFRWLMIRSGRSWRYGVVHPALDRPIDLASLPDDNWKGEEYDQPPGPGKMTLDSLETIVDRLRKMSTGADPR